MPYSNNNAVKIYYRWTGRDRACLGSQGRPEPEPVARNGYHTSIAGKLSTGRRIAKWTS